MPDDDLTEAEYIEALEALGFKDRGGLGYWRLPIEGRHVSVSDLNAGTNYRDKAKYMMEMLRVEKERA